jgi:hypothetical protein
MNKLIPLVEYIDLFYDAQKINEDIQSQQGPLVLNNVLLQRAGSKNQNGRVYPRPILERESAKYNQEFVGQRRALGELDHPESTVINLKNVSHVITEMHWNGDDLMGSIEVLSTPSGNIVKELMKNGIRLGVSSRGVGSVRQLGENTVEVEEDFALLGWDIVSNPSTQGAFLNENALVRSKKDRVSSLITDFFTELGA